MNTPTSKNPTGNSAVKIIQDGEAYHVYIGMYDMWLTRKRLLELRKALTSISI